MPKKHFSEITSLKGLFILIIVLHNASLVNPVFPNIPGIPYICMFGGIFGNSMFFMLSGFLLSVTYKDQITSARISFQDYIRRRLVKLYPLYLLTNIVSLIISIWRYGISGLQLEKLAFTRLLQNGGGLKANNPYNAPSWFISALIVCYTVYFLLCRISGSSIRYRCALFLGIAWGYALSILNLSIPFSYAGNGVAFMNFFIGCIIAEYFPKIRSSSHKWIRPTVFISLLGIGFLFLNYGVEVICGSVETAASFVISPMIVYLALSDGLCSRLLRLRPLVCLGKISASIFFWHLPVLYIMQDLVVSGEVLENGLFIVYLAVLILWSILSNRLLER